MVNMNKLHKILSTFALLVLFTSAIPTVSAIGATPLRTILKAAPGETVEGYIIAQNTEEITQEVVLKKGDFRIREDETMQFLMEKDPENEWSMQDWVELTDNNVILEPNQGQRLKYTVTIPGDAKSQSYYGTIFVSSRTPGTESGGGVGISTNIAHLILLEVTGDLKTDIELQSFTIDKKQYGTAEKEVRFETVLFNSGNTHTAPSGTITIKDSENTFIDEFFINEDKFNSLPSRQKTIVERWSYAEVDPGAYTAYLHGETVDGQIFSGELKFEIQPDEEEGKVVIEGETIINETITIETEKVSRPTPTTNMIVLYLVIFTVFASAVVKVAQQYLPKRKHKKHSKKKRKKFLGLFSIMLILGSVTISQVSAQNTLDLDVQLTVEIGQIEEFDLVGCWAEKLLAPGEWWFDPSDSTANLNQPGDRETTGSGDQYSWYDIAGGNPNGSLSPSSNTKTFGYDDCQFEVTAENWSDWNITLYGNDFENIPDTFEIPDMTGYSSTGFDYNLESEDPNTGGGTQYPVDEGEHGFFIVNKSAGMLATATDTGSAGGTTYSSQKTYDATTCGDGSARPCYHFIPSIASPQTIFDPSTSPPTNNVTDETFVVRFGMGAGSPVSAGDYDMTVTLTLNTTP